MKFNLAGIMKNAWAIARHAKNVNGGKASEYFALSLKQSKIIFFDKTFDYAQRDQAEHRIYRMGQKEDVTYYDLTGDVNLEHTIDQNIEYKQNLLDEFKKLLNKGDEVDWQKII